MPRRIALVASSYHPHHGGVESHVREVSAQLRREGDEVEVWTVDRGERLGTRMLDGVVVRYLPTPLPTRSLVGVARFAGAFPRAWREWRTAQATFRPDVVHVQCFGPNGVYAAGLVQRATLPLVVSSHGETFADAHDAFGESAILPWALRAAVRRAAAVTGCSTSVVDHLATHFGATGTVVVPNGVDLDVAVPPSATLAPRERHAADAEARAKVVLGVGRLEHNKGFDLLLQAVARLGSGAGPTPVVRIVGDGTERDSLARLATSLGIADHVELVGPLDAAEVAGEMARADVVVVPSRAESFGIVVLEAWRAGTPVVATSLGGPAGFVHHATDGILVDPTDVAALAAAISGVVTDRQLARTLAAAGLTTVRGYTWTATAQAYSAIYERVLSEHRA